MSEIKLSFEVVPEAFNKYVSIRARISGWDRGSDGGPILCKIKNSEFAKLSDQFRVSDVKDFGFGIFGREVLDIENNYVIAKYKGHGSWRRSGQSTQEYENLILDYHLGLYERQGFDNDNSVREKIAYKQELFAKSFKKIMDVIRQYELKKATPPPKIDLNKTFKI